MHDSTLETRLAELESRAGVSGNHHRRPQQNRDRPRDRDGEDAGAYASDDREAEGDPTLPYRLPGGRNATAALLRRKKAGFPAFLSSSCRSAKISGSRSHRGRRSRLYHGRDHDRGRGRRSNRHDHGHDRDRGHARRARDRAPALPQSLRGWRRLPH